VDGKDKYLNAAMPEALAAMVAHLLQQMRLQNATIDELRARAEQNDNDMQVRGKMIEQFREQLKEAEERRNEYVRKHVMATEHIRELIEQLAEARKDKRKAKKKAKKR